jgi:hypothetical protein
VQVIRRLYLYGMSGVMLAILATGLQILLRAALDAIGVAGDPVFGMASSREQLSLAGALIGVGLPVWAIHWWLIARSLRPGYDDAAEERDSTLRSFYLTAVLAITLLFLLFAALDLVRPFFRLILGAGGDAFYRPDPAGGLATCLVAGGAWLLHVWFRRADMAAGPLGSGSMVWPRVYLYGAQLVGVFVLIGVIRTLIELVVDTIDTQPAHGDTAWTRELAAGEIATLVVVGVAFVVHAWYTALLLRDPGWRGVGERPASLRVAYFAILLAAATGYVLTDMGNAARSILLQLLGEPGGLATIGSGARSLAGQVMIPLVSVIPWLLAGLAARRQMLAEAAGSDDAGRSASMARLDLYLVSVVALGFGAVAIGWLVGFAIDAVLGGTRAVGTSWKVEVAGMFPLAVLGLGLWTARWWRVVARRAADPGGEAESTIRRFALLLVLGASILASVGSVAFILYRLFGTILGIHFGDSVVSALSTPVGALVIAASVAIYHGLLLRQDLPIRAAREARPMPPGATPAAGGITAAPEESGDVATSPGGPGLTGDRGAQRTIVVVADTSEALEAAVEALRRALPDGARLLEP